MKPVIIFIACILLSARLHAHIINADTLIVQNDTSICAGNSVSLSISLPSVTGIVFLDPGSEFEYSFTMPAPGWQMGSGGWTVGNAPFGNESGGDPPEFDYVTLWTANIPDNADGFDLYVRKTIDLTGQNLSNTFWHLGVDNGFALYINGVQIASGFDGGYASRWEYEGLVPPGLLVNGNNVIAVALRDNGGLTAFDMMIDSKPICPCPTVLWSTGETTPDIKVTPLQSQQYFVTVTEGAIITKDSVNITVDNSSFQSIDATICEGQSYAGHTTTGIYLDTLGSGGGCDSVRRLNLTVLPKPRPDLGGSKTICSGDSLSLSPGSFDNYTWQDGSHQPSFKVKQSGIYSVTVTNTCGSATSQVQVIAKFCDLYFPTAFTPNRDGRNDLFKILYAYNLSDYHLVIYNLWGQKIFETRDPATGWDGRLSGQLQQQGVFIWFCEFKRPANPEKISMKGTVTLLR